MVPRVLQDHQGYLDHQECQEQQGYQDQQGYQEFQVRFIIWQMAKESFIFCKPRFS